jgi:hypothetical protein
MNKFYVTVVACLTFISAAFSQDRYWVGPATNSNWNNTANWSATDGGAGGASVPNGISSNAIFNSNAVVNLDILNPSLNRLLISNNSTVTIYSAQNSRLTIHGTSTSFPGLTINAGSTLRDSTNNTAVDFEVYFASNARGRIDGTWVFNSIDVPVNLGPYFNITDTLGLNNKVLVNGKIYVGNPSTYPIFNAFNYLDFLAGSEYHLDGNKGSIFGASWNIASTIRITGRTTTGPIINGTRPVSKIIYNCPNQATQLSMNLINRQFKSDLIIENTNGQELVLFGSGSNNNPLTIANAIDGKLEISGNSYVLLSNSNVGNRTNTLTIGGDLIVSGGTLDFYKFNIASTPSTIKVNGNILHTGGTIKATSNSNSTTQEYFIIEMNGTAPQTITSIPGSWSTPRNFITLRMNNAAGVTLNTPLSVGLLSWNSANKGILHTTPTNIITVMSSQTGVLPAYLPANNGYVDGPIRRRTANQGQYEIPVGKNGDLHMIELAPNSTAESYYVVEYFDYSYSDLSVQPPLSAVSDQYFWSVAKESGADASIRMFLESAIAGAKSTDALLPAKYNGTDWLNIKGSTGTSLVPGNSSAGYVTTDLQTSYGDYTIAYGAQSALPVNLVSFNGKKLNSGRSQLTWVISSNARPEKFEILRSTDGKNFTSIGTVTGVITKLQYDFEDAQMVNGNNFYRLKLYDKDGSVNYSKIITLMNGTTGFFMTSMLPTIVYDRAKVNISSSRKGSVQLVVTDVNGRIVHQQISAITAENQDIWVELRSLSKGAYHITGYFDGNRSQTIRFVKQ